MRASLTVTLLVLAATGSTAAQSRELRDTIAAREARVHDDSTDAGAYYRLSLAYYSAKRYDDESRALRRAIAIDPRYAPAYLSLSWEPFERRPKLYEEERKHRVPPEWRAPLENARRSERQAFLIDPFVDLRVQGVPAAPEGIVTLEDYGEFTTVLLLYLAVGAFGDGRYELAYGALHRYQERALANKPRDSLPDFIFLYRGLSAAHLGVYTVAIEDIQTILDRSLKKELADTLIQIELGTNDWRYVLATIYEKAHRPADALRLYQEAIANDLGLYMGHVRLAEMYRQFKMWPQAIEEQQRAIATNPDDPTALYELGVILSEAGKPAEAEAPLRQAMERNALDPRIPYQLGIVDQALAKPADARTAFQRVTALGSHLHERITTDAKQRLAALP